MAESELSLMQENNLREIIHNYPIILDKLCKGYKERDAIANAWKKIANSLEFIRDGTYYSIF